MLGGGDKVPGHLVMGSAGERLGAAQEACRPQSASMGSCCRGYRTSWVRFCLMPRAQWTSWTAGWPHRLILSVITFDAA